MTARRISGWRFIAALLCALVSSLPAYALRLASAEPECTMACCKRKKNPQCCKRHLHGGASKHGALLKAVTSCAQGCAASPVQPTGAGEVYRSTIARPESVRGYAALAVNSSGKGSSYNARLYQRPPPTNR